MKFLNIGLLSREMSQILLLGEYAMKLSQQVLILLPVFAARFTAQDESFGHRGQSNEQFAGARSRKILLKS